MAGVRASGDAEDFFSIFVAAFMPFAMATNSASETSLPLVARAKSAASAALMSFTPAAASCAFVDSTSLRLSGRHASSTTYLMREAYRRNQTLSGALGRSQVHSDAHLEARLGAVQRRGFDADVKDQADAIAVRHTLLLEIPE